MKKILNPFILVFTSVLLITGTYVGLRINENSAQWFLLVTAGFLFWLFPTVHWTSRSDYFSKRQIAIQQAGFVSMSYLSWLFVLTLFRDVTLLIVFFVQGSANASYFEGVSKGSPILLMSGILTVLGAWRALRGPIVKEVEIVVSGLPPHLEGLRIAQISDLHIGPMISKKYVEKVVEKVNAIRPDLTVLTGDIFDGNIQNIQESMNPLSLVTPKGKVFYVLGNHEYYWGAEQWVQAFTRLGAQVLMNRGIRMTFAGSSIWIAGVTDPVAEGQKELATLPDVNQAIQGARPDDFKILLSHRPDIAIEAAPAGFQLQLSGHTHGGQFFPWTLIARFFHQHFIGLIRHQGMWIYVSPGTGSWGPPARIGTVPEISLLRIKGDNANRPTTKVI